MYRILVPLDGSPHAERALGWSEVIARALDAEIFLVGLVAPGDKVEDDLAIDVPGDRESFESRGDAMQSYLEEVNGRLQQVEPNAAPGIKSSAEVVLKGRTSGVLADFAKVQNVDLVVMAGDAFSGLRHGFRGSVTGDLVRAMGIPVISIGPRAADWPHVLPRIVLVPLDDSEHSRRILQLLAPLARACGSRLVLLRVVPWPTEVLAVQGAMIPMSLGKARDPRAEDLEQLAADLRAKGMETEVRVVYGDRVQSILETGDELHVGMIAMATHSREGLGHWLFRSVAEEIVAAAGVPVLEFHCAGD